MLCLAHCLELSYVRVVIVSVCRSICPMFHTHAVLFKGLRRESSLDDGRYMIKRQPWFEAAKGWGNLKQQIRFVPRVIKEESHGVKGACF